MKLKVVLSILVALGLVTSLVFLSPFHSEEEGSIHIIVRDETSTIVIDEWVDFYEGDNLYLVLDRNYDIATSDKYSAIYGKMLLSIENIDTDFETSFIHISKDGVSSNLGIDNLPLEDGAVYEFEVRIPN